MNRFFTLRNGMGLGLVIGCMFFLGACKQRCYDCRLVQINGPDAWVYPNDTIEIDTVLTCDRRWVKENNTPDDETYPQSWRCKETN